MGLTAVLLAQTDEAFGRLRDRLAGLGDAEYLWSPVDHGWTIRQAADGRWQADYAFPPPQPPPFTSVAWRILHLADCKLVYHDHAFRAGTLTFPDLEAPTTAAAALARLDQGHALLRAELAGCSEADLAREVRTNWGELWPAWRIFTTMSDHDALHCGELGCLRDLYRERG